jgi:hypothetical protein
MVLNRFKLFKGKIWNLRSNSMNDRVIQQVFNMVKFAAQTIVPIPTRMDCTLVWQTHPAPVDCQGDLHLQYIFLEN